jgi:hypothetical protein
MTDQEIISSLLNNFTKESVGCCRFVSLLVPRYFYLFMVHVTTMLLAQTVQWRMMGSLLNSHRPLPSTPFHYSIIIPSFDDL